MLKVLHSTPAICTIKKERKKERKKGGHLGAQLDSNCDASYRNVSILSRCPSHRSVGFTTKRRCVEDETLLKKWQCPLNARKSTVHNSSLVWKLSLLSISQCSCSVSWLVQD